MTDTTNLNNPLGTHPTNLDKKEKSLPAIFTIKTLDHEANVQLQRLALY